MQAILAVTVPFFALVLCGYLAARRHVLPASAIPGLNAYVLYFALPCLLFNFGASTPIFDLLNPAMLAVIVSAALLVVLLTLAVSLNERVRMQDAAFGALVAAFPNTGFMGVPLLVALMGQAAAGPVICSMLADLFFTSSLCLGLAQATVHGGNGNGNGNGHGDGHENRPENRPESRHADGAGRPAPPQAPSAAMLRAWRALRGALSNPLPWSIALGVLVSVAGIQLPGPLRAMVAMLAASATPVALFTIGAVLWRAGQHAALQPPAGQGAHRKTAVRDYLPVALIKLFVHPLLVFALGTAARALGAPLSSFQLTVLTLAAALPSASNVSLLAERHGADNGRIARIIMSSTVLAFASFTALAWVLGVRPG